MVAPSTFTLSFVPEIAFGANRVDRIAEDVTALSGPAARVLVVSDPGVTAAGLSGRVTMALRDGGHQVELFDSLRSDPLASQIDAAADLARRMRAELVVGVGGGSALDAAKLVAAIATDEPGCEHYAFCAHPFPATRLRKICVPTTAGTGSETTATSILTDRHGVKGWAWGPELKADKVILDPALTVALPAPLTAATGIDALVHAIEACTSRRSFALNDHTCHQAIRLITASLRTAVLEPDNLEARGGMLMAAALAGIGIDNSGTGIAHALAHALGTLGKVHHGRAAGLGLLASLEWSIAADPRPYAAVTLAMGGGDPQATDAENAARLPGLFEDLVREVGLIVRLDDVLSGEDAVERLAETMLAPENRPMCENNLRRPTPEDARHLARRLLTNA